MALNMLRDDSNLESNDVHVGLLVPVCQGIVAWEVSLEDVRSER